MTQKTALSSAIASNFTTTIASGGATSGEIDLVGTTLCGFYMPATFTGTTVTFTACPVSGGTFLAVQDGTGSSISETVSASKFIALDPAKFFGIRFMKIVSGSTEGADRIITLAARFMTSRL